MFTNKLLINALLHLRFEYSIFSLALMIILILNIISEFLGHIHSKISHTIIEFVLIRVYFGQKELFWVQTDFSHCGFNLLVKGEDLCDVQQF